MILSLVGGDDYDCKKVVPGLLREAFAERSGGATSHSKPMSVAQGRLCRGTLPSGKRG